MSINVCVHKNTLNKLEEFLDKLKLNILHQIGQNYLSKKDYRELLRWYLDDKLLNIIDIVKADILSSIARNYCDKDITEEVLISEFI